MSNDIMIPCLVLSTIRYDCIVLSGEKIALPEDLVLTLERRQPCPIQRIAITVDDDGDINQADVFSAIDGLDPNDESHFTKSGLPELKVLNAALKKAGLKKLSGADRDQFWAEYQSVNPLAASGDGEDGDSDDDQDSGDDAGNAPEATEQE